MGIVSNPIYKDLYTTKKRYILVTGGRGSGKSHEVSTFLSLLTYELKQRILFTRYTMASAYLSIIPEFKQKIELLEVQNSFKVNDSDITNIHTKADIIFKGIKTSSGIQTASLKSISGVSCWVVDEAEELVDEETFDTIDLSIRTTEAQNRIILVMNPSNKDHFIYKKWFSNHTEIRYIDGFPIEICTHPDVLHIHTTYLDNVKNLDQSFLNIIYRLKETNPKLYAHKALGQWSDIAEGALMPKYSLRTFKEIKEPVYDSSIAYIDVADEGSDHLAMYVGRNIGTDIYITDIVFSDSNTDITLPLCYQSLKQNNVAYVRVESNSMGAMFGRNLQKMLNDNNVPCKVYFATSTTNKHTRILMDSIFMIENFVFKHESERTAMYELALTEQGRYTKDGKYKHDDAIDAGSGLAMFIRGVLRHLYL